MSVAVRKAIDQLTLEKGEKRGSIWHGSFSVKDVLEKAGLKNTPDHQRYVVYILNQWYPGTIIGPGQADNGGFIKIKIRSI